jgi:calcineurin-like phosphoesterase family protein
MKILLEKHQNIFFTSDTHYNHSNICRATTNWKDATDKTRDFKSLGEMNDALVSNINMNVDENDILFHLGDWSFGGFEMISEFRNRINCKNIHLLLGNHDHHIERNKENIQSLFSSVNQYVKLDIQRPGPTTKSKLDTFRLILMHFPIASWDGMNDGVIHLHGHVHLPMHLRVGQGKSIDVGVDGNNMEPLSLNKILFCLKNQPIHSLSLPQDHHSKEVK